MPPSRPLAVVDEVAEIRRALRAGASVHRISPTGGTRVSADTHRDLRRIDE
jgi:hypothetical protein